MKFRPAYKLKNLLMSKMEFREENDKMKQKNMEAQIRDVLMFYFSVMFHKQNSEGKSVKLDSVFGCFCEGPSDGSHHLQDEKTALRHFRRERGPAKFETWTWQTGRTRLTLKKWENTVQSALRYFKGGKHTEPRKENHTFRADSMNSGPLPERHNSKGRRSLMLWCDWGDSFLLCVCT